MKHTQDTILSKVFLDCLRMVRFMDFLAEIVFWESFFIRNDSKLAFPEKKLFESCFIYFATLPKQVTAIKCFQKKTKNGLNFFQKQPTFCHFTNQTRQQSLLHSTQKVCEEPFADSLGKLWSWVWFVPFLEESKTS